MITKYPPGLTGNPRGSPGFGSWQVWETPNNTFRQYFQFSFGAYTATVLSIIQLIVPGEIYL